MRVRILGPLAVEDDDGRPVPIKGVKQRTLLALLAVNVTRPVSTDRLVDELWGEARVTDATNALQHQVSRLRKALGAAHLASVDGGYVLDLPERAVDAFEFERLAGTGRTQLRSGPTEEAVGCLRDAERLWTGPALDGVDGGWARAQAVRLDELRLDVLEDRIEAELALGLHQEVVADLEALVVDHPFRERLWGHLMLALYRSGRQADALDTFQRARRVLTEEQGLEPGPYLRELEAAVLTHAPALDLTPARPGTAEPLGGARHNVPTPLTSFVGREQELVEVGGVVRECRLVTLTGPGGSGKTRLAIEAARLLSAEGTSDVWVVELASLVRASDLDQAVAAAIGTGDGGRLSASADVGPAIDVGARVSEYLRTRRTVLVLDNCEHLLAGVSTWVDAELAGSPDLRILATSREPLGVIGERQRPVPPLTLPDADTADPDTLERSEAVRLFEARASLVGPFALDATTGPAVAEICRHLDGLPLAIELAAARTKALSVSRIAAELGDRFRFLVSSSRTAPARQRTLRATLDWSHELLDAEERTLFAAASTFEGGWSLDALAALTQAVHIGPADALDLLGGLVDKSLVLARADGRDGLRYDMLETVREYGREQLATTAWEADAVRAHRSYFVGWAEQAEDGLLTRDYRDWQDRLEQDNANLRAAYDGAMADAAWDDALRIASSLWWFWGSADRHADGLGWLEGALAAPDTEDSISPRERIRALTVLCYLAGEQFDLAPAIAAGEKALALSTARGDEWSAAWSKQALALPLELSGDHDRSARYLAEARVVMDAAGEDWRVVAGDLVAGVSALGWGELAKAEGLADDILRRVDALDYEPFRCWGHLLRASVADARGDIATARAEGREALESATRLDLAHDIAFALTLLGRVALRDGDVATAETELQEAIAVAEPAGAHWFVALARVHLADALRDRGAEAAALDVLQAVVNWGDDVEAGQGRGMFFLVLGGDPLALATARLT